MSKIKIREINWCDKGGWGNCPHRREVLRQYLNDLGFYVLTKDEKTLEVFVISEKSLLEKYVL